MDKRRLKAVSRFWRMQHMKYISIQIIPGVKSRQKPASRFSFPRSVWECIRGRSRVSMLGRQRRRATLPLDAGASWSAFTTQSVGTSFLNNLVGRLTEELSKVLMRIVLCAERFPTHVSEGADARFPGSSFSRSAWEWFPGPRPVLL